MELIIMVVDRLMLYIMLVNIENIINSKCLENKIHELISHSVHIYCTKPKQPISNFRLNGDFGFSRLIIYL